MINVLITFKGHYGKRTYTKEYNFKNESHMDAVISKLIQYGKEIVGIHDKTKK